MVCIKRGLSTWTSCRCPPCRALTHRLVKLSGAGALPRPDPAAAWARIDAWTAAGYTPAWISTACGLQPRNIESALTERRAGHVRKLGAKAAAMVLAGDIAAGSAGFGPALGARRRLQALACHGFDTSRIQALSGIHFVTLAAIRRGATTQISAAHHHTIVGLYEGLCGQFGTSGAARARAARLGWVPPWAWDHIDDPGEHPAGGNALHVTRSDQILDQVAVARATAGDQVGLTVAERTAAITILAARGHSDAQIAALLGCTDRTVARHRAAHHIPTRWHAA